MAFLIVTPTGAKTSSEDVIEGLCFLGRLPFTCGAGLYSPRLRIRYSVNGAEILGHWGGVIVYH